MVCDGNVDCDMTWDDEANCRKFSEKKIIHTSAIIINGLYVYGNISAFSCSQAATTCLCQDVHIDCTGQGLNEFPYDAEKEITFL